MAPELRKRKEAPPPPLPAKAKKTKTAPAKTKKAESEKGVVEKAKEAVTAKVEAVKEAVAGSSTAAASTGGAPKVGDTIDLTSFGGEVETHDGKKTTLAKLLEASKTGLLIHTYPKASTPGCTTQACLFRDNYDPLTAAGYSIFGLSNDSPKSNTTFKTKQNLPYTLLCDPAQTLISAIGLKKAPKGTTRGVFIIDKSGKVLASEPGSPAGTLDIAKKVIGVDATGESSAAQAKKLEDKEAAKTAAEVADTAAKVDSNTL